jgi:DNA relaxase NicK
MKKRVKVSLALLIIILLCLWVSNPTENQFTKYIKLTKGSNKKPESNFKKISDNEILKNHDLVENGKLQYDIIKRILYNYKNYIFFSSCTYIDDKDTNYTEVRYSYIGIANNFISTGATKGK